MKTMWHLSDGLDGKGRAYRIVKKVQVEPCPNIKGCFVTDDGKHIQNIYDYENVPTPKFEEYFHEVEDERL